jgi:cobalt-zinc-cadmium efflux system protein
MSARPTASQVKAEHGPTHAPAHAPTHAHTHEHTHAHGADCVHHAALDAVRAGRPDVRSRLAWAFALTALFMVAEVVGGVVANSLALLADAGHMLTDAGALALALGVAIWNARRGDDLRRVQQREAWAALINGLVLLVVAATIIVEAIGRIGAPEPVRTDLMLGVAMVGLVVNVGAALILRPVVRENLNARGAYLHVLGDLLGSVGTIAAAVVIARTGWLLADPLASLVVCGLVTRAALGLVREARSQLR